jgi:DNA anti-recombination protein RmuC
VHDTLGSDGPQYWRISLVVYPEDQSVPATEQSQEIPLAAEPSDAPPAADTPPESLDKVRDILFGGQMRAVEARIQSMDERLRHEQESIRARLERQIADLQSSTSRELRSLDERLTKERLERGEELQALGAELRDAIQNLASRHARLEETTGAADAEMRDMLLQHSAAMTAEIERLSQRLTSELQREVSGLRADKLDIAAMANVFSDMVGRLGGDSRAPASNGPG